MVKSRGKQATPWYLRDAADLFLDGYDDRYYPIFTTYSLLRLADLCITAGSMTAIEAVVASVPAVNIFVPYQDDEPGTDLFRRYLDATWSNKTVTPLNYPGCVQAVDRRDIVKWLREKRLEDLQVDPSARERYVALYAGITEKPSTERVLDSLEEMET